MEVTRQVFRSVRAVSPSLAAQLYWFRVRQRGDITLAVLQTLIHRGDSVVDVGANWGLYTWLFSSLTGPTGHVWAFEPDPAAVASVSRIARGHRQLTVYPIALSDEAGEAHLHVPVFRGQRISALASLRSPESGQEVGDEVLTVRTQRLDTVIPETSAPISFLKCDVEGHEFSVLLGAEAMLRRWHPALLVEIEQRHGGRVLETIEYLVGLGYVAYSLHPDGLVPVADFNLERDQLRFLTTGFIPRGMPAGYVNDFLFLPHGAALDAVTELTARTTAQNP